MEKYVPPDISIKSPERLAQVWGLLPTTTTKPAYVPKTFSDQMVIWNNSGTYKLCIYDTVGNAWLGVTISSI
jgi:hypothetical protein